MKGGMNMIRMRFLGDDLVLLTLREWESMKVLLKYNKEWFNCVFVSIEPWSVTSVADHKIIWVRWYGLPLSFWNKDCFAKVVGEEATLVFVDKSTLIWENLEYARLQVCLPQSYRVKLVKSMQINDQTCNIVIEEELPVFFAGMCKDNLHFLDSSDSVSSSETYVEETTLSVKSCEDEVKLWVGEVFRSKGKEEGGEAVGCGEQGSHTTKMFFGNSPSKSKVCQRKDINSFTNEERKGQKVYEGFDFNNHSSQACAFACNSTLAHAELAKDMLDIECNNTL